MKLETRPYLEQQAVWPLEGRHILAQYDETSIIVYQGFRPSIGAFAIEHQYLGGGVKYRRMSWIKPNFLWLMYRSVWGTRPGNEVILAMRIRRTFFDSILAQAVPSCYDKDLYPDKATWQAAVRTSTVRLQWDPDHDPSGAPLRRRAIQLGLRREVIRAYGQEEILEIIDLTGFVGAQRPHAQSGDYAGLLTPLERVYTPADPATGERLKLS